MVKARSYAPRLGADSLQVVPISQAQAWQRSGRAGREAPGWAYRLYPETAFASLTPVTAPEIQRVNLAGVVLQLLALGVEDVVGFDFIDPPPPLSLLRALELLCALGGVGADGRCDMEDAMTYPCMVVIVALFFINTHRLTPLGLQMSRLPVEPMFARCLLRALDDGCAVQMLAITAAVSADAPFFSTRHRADEDEDGQGARAHPARRFFSPLGDHITMMDVLLAYIDVPVGQRTSWCNQHMLSARWDMRGTTIVYMDACCRRDSMQY